MILRRLSLSGTLLVGFAHAVAAASLPTVTGPIAGAPFVASTSFDLTAGGYVEEEFFVEGTATAYASASALGSDGHWSATPGATAAYKTRVVVRLPANARESHCPVVVEWLNVSGGLDAAPDWIFAHTMLMRDGYAWVGVSAQFVGVEGGTNPLGLNLSLKALNPARYGSLSHPGDSLSCDMFSQVAAAPMSSTGVRPLGPLTARRLLGVGESQSAFRLVTYVNAIHPLVHAYDGYLIHSRGGGGAPLAQSPQTPVDTPTPAFIRDDLHVPVLTFETETDLLGLGFIRARQPDTAHLHVWEVAGTAHGDLYQLCAGMTDSGPAGLAPW